MKKNGLEISANGSKRWYKDGKLHREDGPAIIYTNGAQRWYKEGKLHRKGGPAVLTKNGNKKWYRDGIRRGEPGNIVHIDIGDKTDYPVITLCGLTRGICHDFDITWIHTTTRVETWGLKAFKQWCTVCNPSLQPRLRYSGAEHIDITERGYPIITLCGLTISMKERYNYSWLSIESYTKGHSDSRGLKKCRTCYNHTDLPLYELAAMSL